MWRDPKRLYHSGDACYGAVRAHIRLREAALGLCIEEPRHDPIEAENIKILQSTPSGRVGDPSGAKYKT